MMHYERGALRSMINKKYPCERCGGPYEIFMVRPSLWNSSGLNGQVCIQCFESVIGRKLVIEDFIPNAPCNWYFQEKYSRDSNSVGALYCS